MVDVISFGQVWLVKYNLKLNSKSHKKLDPKTKKKHKTTIHKKSYFNNQRRFKMVIRNPRDSSFSKRRLSDGLRDQAQGWRWRRQEDPAAWPFHRHSDAAFRWWLGLLPGSAEEVCRYHCLKVLVGDGTRWLFLTRSHCWF